MPERYPLRRIELEAELVVRPCVTLERWEDPGDYPNGCAGGPKPSYNYLELDDPGSITITLDGLAEEFRDWMTAPTDTEHDSLWDHFELVPVLPSAHGEIKLALREIKSLRYHVSRDKDLGTIQARLRACEMKLHAMEKTLREVSPQHARAVDAVADELFKLAHGEQL